MKDVNILKIYQISKRAFNIKKSWFGIYKNWSTSYHLFWWRGSTNKISERIIKRSTGRTMYILDEPTTGLHQHDIKELLEILHTFVALGNGLL